MGDRRDQLGVLLTCGADEIEAMQHFYVEVCGFELERVWRDAKGRVALLDLRDGPMRLKVAREGVLEGVPAAPTTRVTLLVEVVDADARGRAIRARCPDLTPKAIELGGAAAWCFDDPLGNQVWFVTYSEESPSRLGALQPEET